MQPPAIRFPGDRELRLEGAGGCPHLSGMTRRIPMTSFDSSSIAAGGYDARSETLRLRYIDGDIYDYEKVPQAVFDDLLDAPSKGQFVNWHVKPHYSFARVGRAKPNPAGSDRKPGRQRGVTA